MFESLPSPWKAQASHFLSTCCTLSCLLFPSFAPPNSLQPGPLSRAGSVLCCSYCIALWSCRLFSCLFVSAQAACFQFSFAFNFQSIGKMRVASVATWLSPSEWCLGNVCALKPLVRRSCYNSCAGRGSSTAHLQAYPTPLGKGLAGICFQVL